jgi:hypothetical protein
VENTHLSILTLSLTVKMLSFINSIDSTGIMPVPAILATTLKYSPI